MSQSSVARVLVVARRDPQQPFAVDLKRAGYVVLEASTMEAANETLEHVRPDVVVVHDHAFGRRELESLWNAASRHHVPVLAVAKAIDEGEGLSAETLARHVQALLSGAAPTSGPAAESAVAGTLIVGPLVIDLDRHEARLGDTPLTLTPKEFELLTHLARRPGRVWNRQQLIDLVWSYDYVDPRVVTVHIANLRKKLTAAARQAAAAPGPGRAPVVIESVRTVGYRLVTPDAPSMAGGRDETKAAGPAKRPGGRPSCPELLPFVGRQGELEALRRRLEAARAGQVQIVALVGDAGMGKTRLAQELSDHVAELGVAFDWGRCHDGQDRPAYEPWAEIVGRWERDDLPVGLRGLFGRRLSRWQERDRQAEYARRELLEDLLAALRWRADQTPTVIVLEDVHWADPSTLLVLQHVARYLHDASLMLVFSYRPAEGRVSPLLTSIVAEVARADTGLILKLAPLDRAEVASIVRSYEQEGLNVGPFEQTVTDLFDLTDANPFFLTQVMRLLLRRPDASVRVADLDLGREPGVNSVILQRLSRLSPPSRQWLEAGAVLGGSFAAGLASEIAQLPHDLSAEAVREALENGIVLTAAESPGHCQFVHSLVREVLCAEIRADRLGTLHARAAGLLEDLHAGELDRHAAELARHYSAAAGAGSATKAVHYQILAGRVAAAQYAWDEACSHWQRALSLLDLLPVDAVERRSQSVARVLEETGDARRLNAETDAAIAAYESAAACLPPGENFWRARLKRKEVELFHLLGQDTQAAARAREAAELLGPPEEAARPPAWWHEWLEVEVAHAALHYWADEAEEAQAVLDAMSAAVEEHGTARQRAEYNELTVMVELDSTAFVATPEAVKRAEACAACLAELASPGDQLSAEQILGLAYLHSAEHVGLARRHLARFLELARRQHDIVSELDALHQLSCWHRWRGEVEEVRRCASEVISLIEADERQSTTYVLANARANLAWTAWRDGRTSESQELAVAALEELQGHSLCEWQARWVLFGLALLDADLAKAVTQAKAMLEPSQRQMPQDLRALLRRLVDDQAAGLSPDPGTLEALTATARACGYL